MYRSYFLFVTVCVEISTDCIDIPNYKDKYGTTCSQTVNFGNCKHGEPLLSIQQLHDEANSDGVSVLEACCACGGGDYDEDFDESLLDY